MMIAHRISPVHHWNPCRVELVGTYSLIGIMATNDVTKSSRLRHFQSLDMVMIIVYAIWMGIEADWNDALLITEPWHEDTPVVPLLWLAPGSTDVCSGFGAGAANDGAWLLCSCHLARLVAPGPRCHCTTKQINSDPPAFCNSKLFPQEHARARKDASAIFQLAEHFFCTALRGGEECVGGQTLPSGPTLLAHGRLHYQRCQADSIN